MMNSILHCPRCGSADVSRHFTPVPAKNEGDDWAPKREEAYMCAACKLFEEELNTSDTYRTFRERWGDTIEEISLAEMQASIDERNQREDDEARAFKWPREHEVTDRTKRSAELATTRGYTEIETDVATLEGVTLPVMKCGYPVGDDYIADVLRNPDDDAPRRAYAAFLRTFDTDAARGSATFVEKQLEMAAAFRRDPRADLRPQIPFDNTFGCSYTQDAWKGTAFERYKNSPEAKLWWRHPGPATETWHGNGLTESTAILDNEGLISDLQFYRGFVEHVAVRAARFLEIADELFSRAPIRYLTLTYCKGPDHTDEGLLKEVLASPYLDRIRYLRLPAKAFGFINAYTELNRLADADLELIAGSTHLRGLRALDVSDNTRLTARGFDALAATKNLPSLNGVVFTIWRYFQPTFTWGPMGELQRELASRPLAGYRAELEARHGRIEWLHVADNYGKDEPDVEALVEHSVRG